MIAKDRLPLVMGMEADRMIDLQLTDDNVYPERDVIVEERTLARRQRAEFAVGRADQRRPVPASSLPPAGDRLAARDRGLPPGGRGERSIARGTRPTMP